MTTAVKQQMPTAEGFIRLFSFFDGPSGYLVAFWRTAEHAQAFAQSPTHREAMASLDREKFEYSHFVGLWKADSVHQRNIYCEECGTANAAPAQECSNCHNALDDIFRQPTMATT